MFRLARAFAAHIHKVWIYMETRNKILNSSPAGYGKWFKFSNTSFLPNGPRQTVQTQIRLLKKKQSDQGLLCLLFRQHFVNSSPENPTFYLRIEREKSLKF